MNKIIAVTYEFPYVLAPTFLHFFVTAVCMELVTRRGCFSSSVLYMPMRDNVLTAAAGVASIAFMNLSLQANSVGFYQITKLWGVPVIVLYEYFSAGTVYSTKIYCSLVFLLFGVGLATVNDIELNATGFTLAVIAVLTTTQFHLWQGSKQKQYGLSPIQCTHSIALPQRRSGVSLPKSGMDVILIGVSCVLAMGVNITNFGLIAKTSVLTFQVVGHAKTSELDNITVCGCCGKRRSGVSLPKSGMDVILIGVSCVLAMGVNITNFGLIAKTSVLTFQVVGHAKTCLILSSGFLFFPHLDAPQEQVLENILGLSIAVAGMILYGHLRDVRACNRAGEAKLDCIDRIFMALGLTKGRRASNGTNLSIMESQDSPPAACSTSWLE
eukprot:CAMPEP_0172214056 /NCGR_PEP_ID=MMETSP1050-20130122/37949_1 /TAXON_ID=233186 /ORGANISM="Cryptomonas curvata, Strain CCAP979/52" /LENGTH=382 /DNA_ID=CAMNT_0012894983 /DNA_START=279 /DNA_END=1429 /DNA_ORIENTATION=+